MLQSRGYYTFKVEEKDVTIRFCTYSIKRFCERNGNMTLADFFNLLSGSMTLTQLIDLMWCAGEAYALEQKKEYAATDYEVSEWFDHIGGIGSQGYHDLIKALVDSQMPPKSDKPKNAKSR